MFDILSSRTPPFPRKGGANSDSPQSSIKRLDQIGIKDKRRPSPFDKKGCPQGDSARAPHQSKLGAGQAPRVPIWQMKGVSDAINRILGAVRNKERIILFGDADLDGVASVVILKEALEILENPAFLIYFPDWEKESYGLNKNALKFLKKYVPGLLIVLDCGITNFEEVAQANKLGFEIIIIDHHQVLEELPKASVIVNPLMENDPCPFKKFSCAGIVYYFVKALLFEAQKTFEPEKFLELAMLGTLYDQMPLIEENKKIIEQGLLALKLTKRPGLIALLKALDVEEFSENEIRKDIISVLAASETKNHKDEAFLLLTENSKAKVKEFTKILLGKSKIKKEKAKQVFQELEQGLDFSLPLIFAGSKNWPLIVIGVVATKIYRKYDKPVFIYNQSSKESRGTVRAPKNIDSVKLMSKCSHFLESYGGHAQASGFRIKNENLEGFKKCLIERFNCSGKPPSGRRG